MQNKQNGGENYDFDEKTKQAIGNLWEERVNGRFSNDREGFTKAFLEIQENAGFDKTKKLSASSLLNCGYDVSS